MPYFFAMISFAACVILTPLVRKAAALQGWVANPTADRWHKKPTALMGGIAIYAAISIPLLIHTDFSEFSRVFSHDFDNGLPVSAVVWIGMTAVFLLGLVDDLIRLKPQTKLLGQILVASLVAFLGFRLRWFESMTLDTLLTIFWIVGITNAFNLLDNMDGLCAGIGMISAFTVLAIFHGIHSDCAQIAAMTAAALAAFLLYNFNPATIFMGDCGSLTIGFIISILTLMISDTPIINSLSGIAAPVMVVLTPIMDTTLVTLIRILSGRKASTGGRDHASHRLVLMGLSERGAVLLLYGIGTISGIGAVFVYRNDTLTAPSVIIPVLLAVLLMGIYLSQLRVYPEKEFSMLRNRTFTPILIDLTYKRQLLLILLDFGMIAFSYYLSYRLRFDSTDFLFYFKIFLKSLPAVISCKLIAFFVVGVYRGIWGYMSSNDVAVYLKASTFATFLSVTAVTFIYRFEDFSKGIFIIDWLLTTAALLGTRGFFRLTGDAMRRKTLKGETVIIYGAGRGGEILLREIMHNQRLNIKPAGFIDDDPLKNGKKLQGYSVLGSFETLPAILKNDDITTLLISFKGQSPEKMADIQDFCRKHAIALKQFSIQIDTIDESV
jgi:UDP-GlcNAc:undecaprenyl-phosphate GlcNAc-1-phosphate transferase